MKLFIFGLAFLDHNEVYNSSYGSIKSNPNLTGDYPTYAKYHYLIKRDDPKERITVDFVLFSLQKHFSCAYESAKIYDGDSTNASLVGPIHGYCGPCPPPTFTSTGNSLLIVFVSHGTITSSGFNVTYRGKLSLMFLISNKFHLLLEGELFQRRIMQ